MNKPDLKKIKCPHCDREQSSAMISKDANCRGVFFKCKNCKKEFELRIKDR